jgi:hypothetical protein
VSDRPKLLTQFSKALDGPIRVVEKLRQLQGQGNPPKKVVFNDIVAGDVDIISINYTSIDSSKTYDFSNQVKLINIYESILKPAIFAELEVADPASILQDVGMRPGDFITISFKTSKSDTEPTTYVLAITNIANLSMKSNLKMQTYTLALASPEILRNSVTTMSLKFKDSVSNAVRKIFDNYIKTDKKVNIDGTRSIEDMVPFTAMRPFAAINYMLRYAYSSKYKSSAYVFFENKNGYQFTSIEKLIKQGVDSQNKGNSTTDKEFFYDSATKESVKDVNIRNIIALKKLSSGSFSDSSKITNLVNAYDFIRGKYSSFLFTAGKEEFELLSGKTSVANKAEFDQSYGKVTKNIEFVPISSDVTDKNIAEHLAKRKGFSYFLDQDIMQILVYGDTELTVGNVIKCTIANPTSFESNQTNQAQKSGLYLVYSLRHMILNTDRPQHMISMELRRNKPLENGNNV